MKTLLLNTVTTAAVALGAVEASSVEQDVIQWAFRGIITVGCALIYHQLRQTNKKLDSIEELDRDVRDLERYMRAIVRVLARGARDHGGQRATDELILSVEAELNLKERAAT
jgi:hypothetical protein